MKNTMWQINVYIFLSWDGILKLIISQDAEIILIVFYLAFTLISKYTLHIPIHQTLRHC